MIVIEYWSDKGKKSFEDGVKKALNDEYNSDEKIYIKLAYEHYSDHYREFSYYKTVTYESCDISFLNYDGIGEYYGSKKVFEPLYLHSKHDWILIIIFIIAICIIFITTFDYFFYTKRKFDLGMIDVIF